MSQVLI